MKRAIQSIDRALKHLNNLEADYRAEDFLVSLGNKTHSALLVQKDSDDLNVGIYLAPEVTDSLNSLKSWDARRWSPKQVSAFSVAVEEVSHFNYLLHHVRQGRAVSQLELEMQGEVDRFLLTFFTYLKNKVSPQQLFNELFDHYFSGFRWRSDLRDEEKDRYVEANHFAQRFIQKCEKVLARTPNTDQALQLIRRFYRLTPTEKISFIRR